MAGSILTSCLIRPAIRRGFGTVCPRSTRPASRSQLFAAKMHVNIAARGFVQRMAIDKALPGLVDCQRPPRVTWEPCSLIYPTSIVSLTGPAYRCQVGTLNALRDTKCMPYLTWALCTVLSLDRRSAYAEGRARRLSERTRKFRTTKD